MTTEKMSDEAEIALFITPQSAWDSMFEDCAKAQRSIDFEQYILKDDEAGMRFLELFRAKANSGIAIHLILDRVGSRSLYASKIIADIIQAGGTVRFYNRINILNLFAPRTWFPRNHSKLMLVDNNVAYVGSVCVSKEMAEWRDLHARLTGPVVADIQNYFTHVWKHRYRSWRREFTRAIGKKLNAPQEFTFVAALTRFRTNLIYRNLIEQINQARKSVYLVTPYFLPPFLLSHALFQAARRGVNVKIMMSAKSDSALADYVSQSYFHKFLRLGLTILLYKPTIIHAKYAVIDDKWATLGSTNMDYLSLRRNREANILIKDPETIGKLHELFSNDEKQCDKVDYDFCRKRPLYAKIVGRIGRIMKQVL